MVVVVGFGGFCMLGLMDWWIGRLVGEKGSRKLLRRQDIAIESIMSAAWYCSAALGAVGVALSVAGFVG